METITLKSSPLRGLVSSVKIKQKNKLKPAISDSGMGLFRKKIAHELKAAKTRNRKFKSLRELPLIKGTQSLYVMDWKQSKLTYFRGIKDMLGYQKDEFDMNMALDCVHPEDRRIVYQIIRSIIAESIISDVSDDNHYLNLTFRLRKKDGNYIKVLCRSSPFHIDSCGKLISNLTFLTNISFINNGCNKVEYDFYSNTIDKTLFKNYIYKEYIDLFTKRELQIIKLLKQGLTNKQIASQLYISIHTVITHRKNILKKSKCHNSTELLAFTECHGII